MSQDNTEEGPTNEHRIDVIKLGPIAKHPNADTLGLVQVYGYTCAIKLGDFQEGDLAVYVEPDFVMPDAPEYAFMGSSKRVKTRRFRGEWSQGLILKAPPGTKEGQDVMGLLGVTRWCPPEERKEKYAAAKQQRTRKWWTFRFWRIMFQESVRWLRSWKLVKEWDGVTEEVHPTLKGIPPYALNNYRKGSAFAPKGFGNIIPEGTEVIVTEKIHGTNARYAFRDGRMWCGSRNQWRAYDPSSWWWKALLDNPWIAEWCVANPTRSLHGEIYGVQKGFDYDVDPVSRLGFRVFDIRNADGTYESASTTYQEAMEMLRGDSPRVHERYCPIVYRGPYDVAKMEEIAEGQSIIADHMREGIVIKPAQEIVIEGMGRVALKLVSNRYLERTTE